MYGSSYKPKGSTYTPRNHLEVSDDEDSSEEKVSRESSPRRFEMTTPGTKLAQEITDEFLVCKICLEQYNNPKSLNCLHTFCETCIENHVASESTYKKYSDYREFTCPLCRKRTQLPIGGVKKLPDNFLVANLGEVIGRQRPNKFPFCDICKLVSQKHKEAASKCLDCNKLLCKQCIDMHRDTKVTAGHNIFDVEIEKDIECKEHQDEVVRFYCEPCETCICVLCTFNEHKDHDITQFGEAVVKYRGTIQTMLDGCKTKIEKFDTQVVAINKTEEVIKDCEQNIHDSAIAFISSVRTKEKQLIDELHKVYGRDLMEYIDNKKELTTTIEGLRATCNLTEVILKGKDIELLLLKKDVQKKLMSLGDITIKSLPNTIAKVVKFTPGEIDLGCIDDISKGVSKPRVKKKITDSSGKSKTVQGSEEFVSYVDNQTQTDLSGSDIRTGDESDTDDSDSDDDSSSESGSDSGEESGKEKYETSEAGVQTEQVNLQPEDCQRRL